MHHMAMHIANYSSSFMRMLFIKHSFQYTTIRTSNYDFACTITLCIQCRIKFLQFKRGTSQGQKHAELLINDSWNLIVCLHQPSPNKSLNEREKAY